jgi:SRSO17 transposase
VKKKGSIVKRIVGRLVALALAIGVVLAPAIY